MKRELPPERRFGTLFSMIFLVIGIYGYLKGWPASALVASVAASGLIGFVALVSPSLLAPFNKVWFLIGDLLGRIVSPVVLGIIFFLILTPVGSLGRMFGRDVLRIKRPKASSYWIDRCPPGPAADTFNNQY